MATEISPKPITTEDVWHSGEGRTRPNDSEIRSFNLRAVATRTLGLRNLHSHRADTAKAYTAKFGSCPAALLQAFDSAHEYLAGLPLIWWHNGTTKGSLTHIDTTGRGMFQVASKAVPEIKSHMDVVHGIVEGMREE